MEGKRDALTIFGTDYDTPDGTCIRDYVHVCDLIDAHVLGLKWLQKGRGSRVFNLGTGDGFSVREVVDQAGHVTNRPVPIIEGARRPGDCTKLVSGSSRAISELGWSADRSNMKQMITDAWRWHQRVPTMSEHFATSSTNAFSRLTISSYLPTTELSPIS